MKTLYDRDFVEWSRRNAELLRSGQFADADMDNIAEELEDLGKSERRELESRLIVLLTHLLKYRYQPRRRSPSWKATLVVQRDQINRLLKRNPSLRHDLGETIQDVYRTARKAAWAETGSAKLPEAVPWTAEQILDDNYLPG